MIPDDIKNLVLPVLAHRMILKQEARIRKCTVESVLSELITKTRIP